LPAWAATAGDAHGVMKREYWRGDWLREEAIYSSESCIGGK
jgi:hypothetical protein